MRLERISRATGTFITIAHLKEYGNISSTTEDVMLQNILNAAITKVEDISNVSLSANTLKLYSELNTNHKLFILPVASVTSVYNNQTGLTEEYTLSYDKSSLTTSESELVITYVTSVREDVDLRQSVLEYAMALYDGQTDKAILQAIFNKIPKYI